MFVQTFPVDHQPSQAPPASLKSLLDKWSTQAETYSQLALALLAPLHHKLAAIVTAAYKDKKEVKVLLSETLKRTGLGS